MSEKSKQPRGESLDDRRVDGRGLGSPAWFGIGAACGLALSLFGHGLLIAGGPIFPLTVTHAPIAVVWESAPVMMNQWLLGLLMIFGPVLYGAYFASINRFGSAAVAVIVVFHVVCFVTVCGLRDVQW